MDTTQTRIAIRWSPANGNFENYLVTFAAGDNGEEFLKEVPRGAELTATVNELEPETAYVFRVYAVVADDIRSLPATRAIPTGGCSMNLITLSTRQV